MEVTIGLRQSSVAGLDQDHRKSERLVAAPALKGRGGARSGLRWLIVAASVVVHLVVLASFGLLTPKPIFTVTGTEHPIALRLIALPLAKLHRANRAPTRETVRAPVAAASPSPLRPHPVPPPVLAPSSPIAAPPGPLNPARQSQASTPAPSYAPGPMPSAEGGRGVRALLRGTVGCDYDAIVHLTEEEKDRCLRRFGDAARKAEPFIGVDPGKRSVWDAQRAAELERRDGAKAQATMKAQQAGEVGVSKTYDVNAGFNCSIGIATGKTTCHGSPPAPH